MPKTPAYSEPVGDAYVDGNLSVQQFSSGGIDVFDVSYLEGNCKSLYIDHTFAILKTPFIGEVNWEGRRSQKMFSNDAAIFVPSFSHLDHFANLAYEETVIRLKHDLFEVAARNHIDVGQIDFSFRDVTSPATLKFGEALAYIVKDVEYRTWPLLLESASVSLTLSVIRELAPGATTAFRAVRYGLSEMRRRRVLSYIEDNIGRTITLAELAEVANLSLYHFSRQFKNAMGVTPLQYLMKRRVEQAMRMLRSTDDTLVAVSLSCGFSSQSHFSTVFKKVTGMTPASYRFSGG